MQLLLWVFCFNFWNFITSALFFSPLLAWFFIVFSNFEKFWFYNHYNNSGKNHQWMLKPLDEKLLRNIYTIWPSVYFLITRKTTGDTASTKSLILSVMMGGTNWCHVPLMWYIVKDMSPIYCFCQNLILIMIIHFWQEYHEGEETIRQTQIERDFIKQLVWTQKISISWKIIKRLKIHKTQCYVWILIGSWSGRRNL